jgi:hypothetical protein
VALPVRVVLAVVGEEADVRLKDAEVAGVPAQAGQVEEPAHAHVQAEDADAEHEAPVGLTVGAAREDNR